MAAKVDTQVVIDGKVFTICGYESEEYIQKVASYINNKIEEFNSLESLKYQSNDYKNILTQLNIADDYFKSKNQIELLEEELREKDDELCNIKHEVISAQIRDHGKGRCWPGGW